MNKLAKFSIGELVSPDRGTFSEYLSMESDYYFSGLTDNRSTERKITQYNGALFIKKTDTLIQYKVMIAERWNYVTDRNRPSYLFEFLLSGVSTTKCKNKIAKEVL